jgi:hypothetical protein
MDQKTSRSLPTLRLRRCDAAPRETATVAAMTQRLPPDELGFVGENMFRTFCGQARLVCNKSDRDVTGWDFIIEFPMAGPDAGVPLDQRPAKACHVQLKSTAGENGSRVSAKLSAVERLAKDPRPALIVAFRLRSDGQPLAGYVIHLIDDGLAHVLHRLRAAEAKATPKIYRFMLALSARSYNSTWDGMCRP